MAQKKLTNVEPAYAQVQVDGIDRRLAAMDAERAELTERRKLFAPHVPKRPAAKKSDD